MEKMSTALCNKLMATDCFVNIFNAANETELRIYSGTPPATADAAITGSVIAVVVGPASAYLGFDGTSVAGGVLPKESATWADASPAGGTASHYRLVWHTDDDSDDSVNVQYPRVQGTVGVGGADLNVGSTTISGAFTVNTFTQALLPG